MAWSWSHVPKRILRDRRFLRLDDSLQGLLLRLYAAADRWGRGPTDADELAVVAGALNGIPDFDRRLAGLVDAGLVLMSEDGSAWQIVDYDDDAPNDVTRKRPKSDFPPGESGGKHEPAQSGQPPSRDFPGKSGKSPEAPGKAGTVQAFPAKAGRQAGSSSLRSKIPPGGPSKGLPPARQEPTPPASTDARERACALDAAPSPPGGHAPALGGAGSPPAEIPETEPQPGREEQDPPPKPIPRRVRMTRDEELERMQALREQVASLGAT